MYKERENTRAYINKKKEKSSKKEREERYFSSL